MKQSDKDIDKLIMEEKNEIKQTIWAAIDRLRGTNQFHAGDIKLLELVAEIKGADELGCNR